MIPAQDKSTIIPSGFVIVLLRIRELCLEIYETIYNELKTTKARGERLHPDLPIYGTTNRSAGTRAIDAARGGGQKISGGVAKDEKFASSS